MSDKYVYVVRRDKRRIESKNYDDISAAEIRADRLRSVLKEWDPKGMSKVDISRTKKPNQIR
jgi:hypothetical protein